MEYSVLWEEVPEAPRLVFEVDTNVSADTRRIRAFLSNHLYHLPDTRVIESRIRIHTRQKVNLLKAVRDEKFGETVEQFRTKHCMRLLVSAVEVIQHRSDKEERVALTLILVFDDANVWNAFVESFLH